MRCGLGCGNCEFSGMIQHDENKIREIIAGCEFDLKHHSDDLLKAGSAYIETVFLQKQQENLLAEMESMRWCHRYPESIKVDQNHWCGEHKRARWS